MSKLEKAVSENTLNGVTECAFIHRSCSLDRMAQLSERWTFHPSFAHLGYQYNLAIRYNNIATVYERQQCHEKALELYEKSLQLTLDTHPDKHPSLAQCYNNISIVYDSLHDYDKAIEYLKKALAINLSSLPPNHMDLAVVYDNLAMSLYNQHKLKEALEHMKKAYEIRSKNLPSDHPKILNDLDWIQCLEEELSQLQENKTEP